MGRRSTKRYLVIPLPKKAPDTNELVTVARLLLPYLRPRDWPRMRLVCTSWNYAIVDQYRKVKAVTVLDYTGESRLKNVLMAEWHNLLGESWRIRVKGMLFSFAEGFLKKHAKSMESLAFFEHSNCPPVRLSAPFIHMISEPVLCERLTRLDLTGTRVPWVPFVRKFLRRCVNVETLILRGALSRSLGAPEFKEDEMQSSFAELRKIKYLDMTGAAWFTGKLFKSLSPTLQTLILDGCTLNENKFQFITQLKSLKQLSIERGLTDLMILSMKELTSLEILLLNGSRLEDTEFSSEDLLRFTNLHTLCFGSEFRQLVPVQMEQYFSQERVQCTLKRLEMDLSSFNFTTTVLPFSTIGFLQNLTSLHLTFGAMLAPDFHIILRRIFRGCSNLTSLALKIFLSYPKTPEDIEVLKELENLKQLKELSIMSSQIDNCVPAICDAVGTRLQKLRIGPCREVNNEVWIRHFELCCDIREFECVFQKDALNDKNLANTLAELVTSLQSSLRKFTLFHECKANMTIIKAFTRLQECFPRIDFKFYRKCFDAVRRVRAGAFIPDVRLGDVTSVSYATCATSVRANVDPDNPGLQVINIHQLGNGIAGGELDEMLEEDMLDWE